MDMKFAALSFAACFVCALSPASVQAAEPPVAKAPAPVAAEEKKEEEDDVIRYVPSTHQNIIRLMWMLQAYDLKNPDDITNYLRIAECNLYKKYYGDEFEWHKIQKATASYLQKYASNFSNYVEVVQPVTIGRYDFDLQGFNIVDTPELINMTAMQISDDQDFGGKECALPKINSGRYSSSAIVKFKTPINMNFIRVPNDVAQEYLRLVSNEKKDVSRDQTKTVYFRYRVAIDRFSNFEALQNIGDVLIFSGRLIQVDVFADQDLFLPLFSQTYE